MWHLGPLFQVDIVVIVLIACLNHSLDVSPEDSSSRAKGHRLRQYFPLLLLRAHVMYVVHFRGKLCFTIIIFYSNEHILAFRLFYKTFTVQVPSRSRASQVLVGTYAKPFC